jgi:hemoglobin
MKADILGLDDIVLFVNEFYKKVQQDDLIGPVFGSVIQDWQPHLEKMYQFWNAALFGVPGFKGNPFAKHAPLNIGPIHFEQWLILFRETIDSNFEGNMANDAKNRAELMAAMFLKRLESMDRGADKVIV